MYRSKGTSVVKDDVAHTNNFPGVLQLPKCVTSFQWNAKYHVATSQQIADNNIIMLQIPNLTISHLSSKEPMRIVHCRPHYCYATLSSSSSSF